MITWKRLCQRLRSSKPKKGMVVFCISLISQFFLAYIAKHVGHMLAHDAARCGARPQKNNSTSCATLEWTVRDEPYLKKMKPNDPAGVLYDIPVFTGSEFGTQSNPEKNVPINYVREASEEPSFDPFVMLANKHTIATSLTAPMPTNATGKHPSDNITSLNVMQKRNTSPSQLTVKANEHAITTQWPQRRLGSSVRILEKG